MPKCSLMTVIRAGRNHSKWFVKFAKYDEPSGRPKGVVTDDLGQKVQIK